MLQGHQKWLIRSQDFQELVFDNNFFSCHLSLSALIFSQFTQKTYGPPPAVFSFLLYGSSYRLSHNSCQSLV